MSKPPSDYRRIRRAQKHSIQRREEFRIREEFMRRIAEQLQSEQEKDDANHVQKPS